MRTWNELVFSVTGKPLFMVMCSAVVEMAASFPETAGCWNCAEVNCWDHLQSQKYSCFDNKNLQEVLLSSDLLAKVKLLGAENQSLKMIFK